MDKTTCIFTAGIALLLIGLSQVTGINLTAAQSAHANRYTTNAAPNTTPIPEYDHSLFVPIVLRNDPQPSPTPIPGGPTPTRKPTMTPTPSVPVDGRWCSPGQILEVTNNGTLISYMEIRSYVYQCGGFHHNRIIYNIPIDNNTISYVTSDTTVTGQFSRFYVNGNYTFQGQVWTGYYWCNWEVSGFLTAQYPCGNPTATSTPSPSPTSTYGPTPTATPTPTPDPAGWQVILSEDFEGDWPGPWTLEDWDGTTNGEYYWGKRTCRPFQGSYSGWVVGAGANGDSLACSSDYPNHTNSNMEYGPFSLVGAKAAELKFKLWLNVEDYYYDRLCVCASTGFIWFCEICWSGNSGGWVDRTVNLATDFPYLGNLLGQPEVWISLDFSSDYSITYPEGAYVDNVVLRKCPTGASCSMGSALPIPEGSQLREIRMPLRRP